MSGRIIHHSEPKIKSDIDHSPVFYILLQSVYEIILGVSLRKYAKTVSDQDISQRSVERRPDLSVEVL